MEYKIQKIKTGYLITKLSIGDVSKGEFRAGDSWHFEHFMTAIRFLNSEFKPKNLDVIEIKDLGEYLNEVDNTDRRQNG